MFGRSLPDALRRRAGAIEIHVVSSDAPYKAGLPLRRYFRPDDLGVETSAAVGSVAVAVGVGEALSSLLQLPNLSMIFLAAVLFCAVRFGSRAAVIASILSFLAYNFFFIEPIYTFTIAQPYELFALLIFLAVAVFTGSLAGRLRDQREAAMRAARDTHSLYYYSRMLSGASGADDVLWAAAAHLHATLGKRLMLLMAEGETLELKAAWPPDAKPDSTEETAARWALTHGEPAGYGTDTLPRIDFQFRPLLVARGAIAVCGFEPRRTDQPISAEDERILTAVLDQTAIALDRAQLAREAVKAATLEANEKVRDVLLDSLSHDLRTPLASIAGAATALRDLGDKMSEPERREMLQSIDEETQRLSRFVANMIDMSRIEAGGLKVARDFVDVADVVQGAVERARRSFPAQSFKVSIAADLPLVRGDARLIEQVLFNLLDNAHKYAGDTPAAIHARRDGRDVVMSVTDEGPGIKPADLERVFEKFWRGGRADGRKSGAGLGLSICRRLVEAMGGTIVAQSPAIKRRGARFVVRLPAAERRLLEAPV
jgi:two-component system sensor histidine kinase KdpD